MGTLLEKLRPSDGSFLPEGTEPRVLQARAQYYFAPRRADHFGRPHLKSKAAEDLNIFDGRYRTINPAERKTG